MLFAAFVRASINIIYCSRNYLSIVKIKLYKNWRLCKEMLTFNNWILLGASISIYKSNGAAIIINYYFGTAINASYAIADRVLSSVNMFSENLNTAAVPQIMKSYGGGNMRYSEKLVNYISKYSFFLLFSIALPLYCQLPFVLKLWLGMVPEYTLSFTKLAIILCLLGGLGRGIPALIQATGKIKWFQIVSAVLNFSSLPIILFLYSGGSRPEAILSVFCVISALSTVAQLFLLRAIVRFDVKAMIMTSYIRAIIIFISLIPFVVISSFFPVHNFGGLLLFIALSELYLFFSIILLGLDSQERDMICLYAKKIWKSRDMHR